MGETALVRRIIKAVKARYPRAYVIKIADRFRRGVPDLHITFPVVKDERLPDSEELYVEAKTTRGKTSKIQDAEHEKIWDAGAISIVVTSAEEVLSTLKGMGAVK
jgi:hypothetical protein